MLKIIKKVISALGYKLIEKKLYKNSINLEILNAIKGVILVDSVDDSDGTVCDAIRRHKPTYFANGGDRGRDNTPEQALCEELGVEMLWSIGGDEKRDSSSDLVKRAKKAKKAIAPHRAKLKHSGR